jgi:hypothetical protein
LKGDRAIKGKVILTQRKRRRRRKRRGRGGHIYIERDARGERS